MLMLHKGFALLLVCLMGLQSVALLPDSQSHEHVSDQIHQWLHHLGQSHTHETSETESVSISYSDEAYEHSNPQHDSSVTGILMMLPTFFEAPCASARVMADKVLWESPFLRHLFPPPRA
ncbi:hypothetical protein [Lacimicrobium sp. SS2-24]|uniref:hypothetical protein n=1 Tax=Lacimicrobium sp. SS2-24 TaxID=2005569 RepID=UPI000B4BA2CD|nr:hypothetical protein [Lacimicrobium sp. SS2-24]